MGKTSRKTVVVERKNSENGGEREAATANSSGPWGKGIAVLVGSDRPVVKAETPVLRNGATGSPAMGRPSNDIAEQIGRELRGLYAAVVSQPVPDRFLDLLNKLETTAIPSPAGVKARGKR